MPKGVYPRQKNTRIGKWKRTKYHLEILKKHAIQKEQHLSPQTEFKKGQKAWNKEIKYLQITGSKHWNWKNGETKDVNGYFYIRNSSHHRANKKGYVKRAVLVMEQILGRPIKKSEVIHHKGIHFPVSSIENKGDDSPENLGLFKNTGEHSKFHNHLRKKGRFIKI